MLFLSGKIYCCNITSTDVLFTVLSMSFEELSYFSYLARELFHKFSPIVLYIYHLCFSVSIYRFMYMYIILT